MTALPSGPRAVTRLPLMLRAAAILLAGASTVPAVAQDIDYSVDQVVGEGQVNGTITTDGTMGVLQTPNIRRFSLTLRGNGAQTTISSTGGARVQIVGNDVTADLQGIYFDFSGSPGSYILFQQNLFSGNRYWCNAVNRGVCFEGKSVVPGGVFEPTATFERTPTGRQIIATGPGGGTPTPGPTPTPTPTPAPPIFTGDLLSLLESFTLLAWSRAGQMLNTRYQDRLLTGLNQQVSSCNSIGAGMVFGSISGTANGRQEIVPGLTALGGVRIGRYERRGSNVELDTGIAVSLQYDPPDMGSSRPYAALTLAASYQDLSYTRGYLQGGAPLAGEGKTSSIGASVGAQVGWVARVSPQTEAAASLSYLRQWQTTDGYAEAPGVGNPLAATIDRGASRSNVASAAIQLTHLLTDNLEVNVNASVDRAFSGRIDVGGDIGGMRVTSELPDFTSYTLGARAGIRISEQATVDLFVNHVGAPAAIGGHTHGGIGFRLML